MDSKFNFCACFGLLVINYSLFAQAGKELCKTKDGSKVYDSDIQICCQGRIKHRVKGQECCGNSLSSQLYYTAENLCCDGKLEQRKLELAKGDNEICSSIDSCVAVERSCCGKGTINKAEELCCDGRPIQLNETQKSEKDLWACCGNNLMRKNHGYCCGGYVIVNPHIDCCGGRIYDVQTDKCASRMGVPERVGFYEEFCLEKKFDEREQICCYGNLHNQSALSRLDPRQRNTSVGCCDALVMNPKASKCCSIRHYPPYETHLIPNEPEIECCGLGYYNKSSEWCVDGKAVRKQSNMAVCGSQLYNTDVQGCCGGVETFDRCSSSCCEGGGVYNVVPGNMTCCDGYGMDHSTQVCCDYGGPCKKNNASDDKCCINNNGMCATYNSKEATCLSGHIETLPPEGYDFCADTEVYHKFNQLCCYGKVFNKSSGVTSCCGYEAYNEDTQLCCGEMFFDISPSEGSCCAYDEIAYKHGDENNPCKCGKDVLSFEDYEICCNGKKYPGHNRGCCGDQFPYRHKKYACCADREVYRFKNSKCVDGEVVPKDPVLEKLSDVQRLCNRKVGKYDDSWVKHACQDRYAITAILSKVKVIRMNKQSILSFSLLNVTNLNRGPGFKLLSSDIETLKMVIRVPNEKNVKCRKRFFKEGKYIIFFHKRVKDGSVMLRSESSISIIKHRKRTEKLYSSVSRAFCRKKFRKSTSKLMSHDTLV